MTDPCVNARRHLADGEHDGTPAADGSLLCRSCYRRLEQRIAELPALANWLQANVARNDALGELVDGSREAPIPVSLTVIALLGRKHDCAADDCPGGHDPAGADDTPSIPGELDGWIRVVLEEHPDRRLHGPDSTISACAAWLVARLDWIAKQEWVVAMIASFDKLHSAINAAAPYWSGADKPLLLPCEGCDKRALISRPPWIECDQHNGGCGRLFSQVEYDEWAKRWAVWAKEQVA